MAEGAGFVFFEGTLFSWLKGKPKGRSPFLGPPYSDTYPHGRSEPVSEDGHEILRNKHVCCVVCLPPDPLSIRFPSIAGLAWWLTLDLNSWFLRVISWEANPRHILRPANHTNWVRVFEEVLLIGFTGKPNGPTKNDTPNWGQLNQALWVSDGSEELPGPVYFKGCLAKMFMGWWVEGGG